MIGCILFRGKEAQKKKPRKLCGAFFWPTLSRHKFFFNVQLWAGQADLFFYSAPEKEKEEPARKKKNPPEKITFPPLPPEGFFHFFCASFIVLQNTPEDAQNLRLRAVLPIAQLATYCKVLQGLKWTTYRLHHATI